MMHVLSILALSILAATDPQAARKIPGINEKDPYPRGCVDCHVKRANMPAPLSAVMKDWATKVDPKLVEKLQPLSPKGVPLKGKHPNVGAMVKEIPGGCAKCHATGSKAMAALAPMVHVIHLTSDRFLTEFQGECAFCHKFNVKNGVWTVPNAAEK